jgi:hypothetical protein
LKYVGWKILALFAAERASVDDPGCGECLNGCRDMAVAAFAGEHEGVRSHVWCGKHEGIIGE